MHEKLKWTTVRWKMLWPFWTICAVIICLTGWWRYEADQDRPGRFVSVDQYDDWQERPHCRIRHPVPRVCTAGVNGDGCIYGIFIGMTENDRAAHLQHSAPLARDVQFAFTERHLMRPEDGILLTNQQATRRRVLAAFERLRARIQPNDVFVFFFDGHGDRKKLILWESELGRDEFSTQLRRLGMRQRLVVLNACHSGSFARVVEVEEPDLATGIFSSNAAETSWGERFSDGFKSALWEADGNGEVSGLLLANYISTRGQPPETYRGYQHTLIVGDTASVLWRAGPYQEPHDWRLCRRR